MLNTFDKAILAESYAQPIFHIDRGFQYTSKNMYQIISNAQMVQIMSRGGKCIDNGPMKGFWGILKREKYYGHKFVRKQDLIAMIAGFIEYYYNGVSQSIFPSSLRYHGQRDSCF